MDEIGIIKVSILALCIVLPILSLFFFRNKRKEIVLVLFSFTFSIFIVEVFVQLYYPLKMEHNQMFEYDPYLGWRFISNKRGGMVYPKEARHYIKTNSLGFRDNSPPEDMDNHKKVLVIGDSFVSNIAVKDSEVFTEVMERQLKNTAVLNFGVPGYGQVQQYLLLKKWLDKINPDLIILVIYVRNDFCDNVGGFWLHPRPNASWDEESSNLKINPPPPPQPRLAKESTDVPFWKFYNKSRLNGFLNERLNILISKYSKAEQSEHKPSLWKAPEFYLCHIPLSRNTKLKYRVMEALLMKIADYVGEREVPLVFALVPSIVQVEDKLWLKTILDKSEEPENYKRSLPNNKLMQFAENNNLLMIDLLPILQSKSNNEKPCYNRTEQHWNAEGNRVVAHTLMDYLKTEKLFKYIQ